MPNPIYETTASNSGRITTESHDVGTINGLPNNEVAEPPIIYKEIHKTPQAEAYKPTVPEFPSKSAGIGTNDN